MRPLAMAGDAVVFSPSLFSASKEGRIELNEQQIAASGFLTHLLKEIRTLDVENDLANVVQQACNDDFLGVF